MPLLAISTCNRKRKHLYSIKKDRNAAMPLSNEKQRFKNRRRDFGSYFFNDTVATKSSDKLSRRGHSEVPLEIHLSVFASFSHQVKTRHARPAVESLWLVYSFLHPTYIEQSRKLDYWKSNSQSSTSPFWGTAYLFQTLSSKLNLMTALHSSQRSAISTNNKNYIYITFSVTFCLIRCPSQQRQ